MKRDVEDLLSGFVLREEDHKKVLIVEGARQVGKSYMINSFLDSLGSKQILRFNFEKNYTLKNEIDSCNEFSDFNIAMRQHGFKEDENQIIFFDEAQESKNLGKFVRFMKEDWKNKSVILSGSSMTRLFRNCRVPVGRVEKIRLYPYSFREFCRTQNLEPLLQESISNVNNEKYSDFLHDKLLSVYDNYLNVGGLPAVVNSFVAGDPRGTQEELRSEIYLSQEEDFLRKEPQVKHYLFKDAVSATSNNIGFPFSLTKITNNHRDAKSALSLLSDWHILLICDQKSFTATSSFHPKIYLYDIGLAKFLRESTIPSLSIIETIDQSQRTALGGLIENGIYLNLLSGKGFLHNICGWKKNSQRSSEIDFIARVNDSNIPIEVKAAKKVHSKFLAPIWEYLSMAGQNLGVLASCAKPSKHEWNGRVVVNIPIYMCERCVIEMLSPPRAAIR